MTTSFFNAMLNELFVSLADRTTVAQRAQPFLKGYVNIIKQGGRNTHSRFTLAGPRGYSKTLADAQAVADLAGANSNGDYYDWNVTLGRYQGSIRAEVEDILLSEGSDEDAAARAARLIVDQGTGDFAQGLVRLMLSAPFGAIGEAVFTSATDAQGAFDTFSLAFYFQAGTNANGDALNATRLQVGDQVEIRTTVNAAVTGSFGYVLKTNWEIGAVQVSALSAPSTPANPGSWANATKYFVFRRGEGTTVSTGQGEMVASLGAYIPDAPATTSLFGVDRSISTALSGARLLSNDPAANGTLPARVERLISIMRAVYGTREEVGVILNPLDWSTYANQLDVKTRREPSKNAMSGYMSMELNTANGSTEIVSEPEQPHGRILLVPKKGCSFATSNGEIFDIVKAPGDDQVWRVRDASQAVEARPICLNRLYIGAPYRFGVVSAL